MQAMTHEERLDRVARVLRSMRGFEGIVALVTSPELRRSLYGALGERFDMVSVPDPTTDAMFTKVLASASIGILPLRESDRKFTETVGLIAEAVTMSLQGAPASLQGGQTGGPKGSAEPSPSGPAPAKAPEPAEALAAQSAIAAPTGQKAIPQVSAPANKSLPEATVWHLFADLRPEMKSARRLDPLTLLLPGPAPGGKTSELTDWISGKPWAPDILALRFAPTDPAAVDEIADLEAEGFSAPKTLRDRTGLRPWMNTEGRERSVAWLHGVGKDLGVYAVTCEKVMLTFRDTLERTIERYFPAQAASLHAFGARLVPGEEVQDLLADAWDIETFFLREVGDETDRTPQDVRGSISSDKALVAGLCFDRAAYLFLTSGYALSKALMESLIEFRFAQVTRDLSATQQLSVAQGFDAVFFHDCARPVEDYKLNVGVTQIAPDPMPEY